jgi:hypothetical protein
MAKFNFQSLKAVLLTVDMHTDTNKILDNTDVNGYQKCRED